MKRVIREAVRMFLQKIAVALTPIETILMAVPVETAVLMETAYTWSYI
jgi:hypothetical protein